MFTRRLVKKCADSDDQKSDAALHLTLEFFIHAWVKFIAGKFSNVFLIYTLPFLVWSCLATIREAEKQMIASTRKYKKHIRLCAVQAINPYMVMPAIYGSSLRVLF